MSHIFYFFSIFALLWEVLTIKQPEKVHNLIKGDKTTGTYKTYSFMMFLYLMWTFVGLMTSQWISFLVLILFSYVPNPNVFIRRVDGIVSFIILMFILINKYHLNINLLSYLF